MTSTNLDIQKRGAWKGAFLEALSRTGNVTVSAEAAGIDRTTAYLARKTDEAFASAWKVAKATAIERLEERARELAFEGNTALLIFLLKGNKPEKYRDYSKIDHNVSGSLDIKIVEVGMSDIEKGG